MEGEGRDKEKSDVGLLFLSLYYVTLKKRNSRIETETHPLKEGFEIEVENEINVNEIRGKKGKCMKNNPCEMMFTHFVVTGLPKGSYDSFETDKDFNKDCSYFDFEKNEGTGKLLYKYPVNYDDLLLDSMVTDKLSRFTFPTGLRTSTLKRSPSGSSFYELIQGKKCWSDSEHTFVFRLYSEDSGVMYGVCVWKYEILAHEPSFFSGKGKIRDPIPIQLRYLLAPRCYCFLSHYPFFRLHCEVIRRILSEERMWHLGNKKISGALNILESYAAVKPPPVGSKCTISFDQISAPPIIFTRHPNPYHVSQWALVTCLKVLSLENLLLYFNSLILERRIVVICQNLCTVTSVVLAAGILISPFKWQGLLIPVLPDSLAEMINAPVPFVVGLHAIPKKGAMNHFPEEIVVIDLDRNRIHQPPNNPISPIPEATKLAHNLKKDHSQLYPSQGKWGRNSVHLHHHPCDTTKDEEDLATACSSTFSRFLLWLVEKVQQHYVNGSLTPTQRLKTPTKSPIENSSFSIDREKLNDTFLQTVTPNNRAFVKAFLDTQFFSVYVESGDMKL